MAHSHAGVDATTAASGAEHQKRLMMSLGLTSTVFIAEVVSAIVTGSLALLVDAGHMLTDMSVLIASTVTAVLMQRKPSNKRTWGWARLEVLTAAVGALVLLIVGIYALVEAGMRLFGGAADEVHDVRLLLFMGILGLAANVGSIFILAGQSEDNMNMKAAFLEVVNDALGSVAVIASAVVMMLTGWDGFDAIAGGLIALLMKGEKRGIVMVAGNLEVRKALLLHMLQVARIGGLNRHLRQVAGMHNGVNRRKALRDMRHHLMKALFWIHSGKLKVFLIHEMRIRNLDDGPVRRCFCIHQQRHVLPLRHSL